MDNILMMVLLMLVGAVAAIGVILIFLRVFEVMERDNGR